MRRQAGTRTRPGRGAHRELWSSPICAPFPEFRARHGTHSPGVPASQRGLWRGLQTSRRVPPGPCELAPALPVSSLGSPNFAIDNAVGWGLDPRTPTTAPPPSVPKIAYFNGRMYLRRIPKFRVDRQVAQDQGGGRERREGKGRKGTVETNEQTRGRGEGS